MVLKVSENRQFGLSSTSACTQCIGHRCCLANSPPNTTPNRSRLTRRSLSNLSRKLPIRVFSPTKKMRLTNRRTLRRSNWLRSSVTMETRSRHLYMYSVARRTRNSERLHESIPWKTHRMLQKRKKLQTLPNYDTYEVKVPLIYHMPISLLYTVIKIKYVQI